MSSVPYRTWNRATPFLAVPLLAVALDAGTPVLAQTAARPSASPAGDPAARSVYTLIELERCKRVPGGKDGGQDGGRWMCRGPTGFEVVFAEGDLRQFLSYGAKASEQRAAKQTLGPFNSIFKDTAGAATGDRATIQWRGTIQGNRFVPFASIMRYHTDTGDDGSGKRQRSQVLVVTKLGAPDGVEACHIAYIDAIANKDANALATKTADETARGFDCRKEPAITGLKGAVPAVPPART
jgi:hypothetical protein